MKSPLSLVLDPQVPYGTIDDNGLIELANSARKGIEYKFFELFASLIPFSFRDWSSILHLSERTLQRHQKQKKAFDSLQSEKILEVALLYKRGVEIFGSNTNMNAWLDTENLVMGKVRPKSLQESSFGIRRINDELTRIEYGVLS